MTLLMTVEGGEAFGGPSPLEVRSPIGEGVRGAFLSGASEGAGGPVRKVAGRGCEGVEDGVGVVAVWRRVGRTTQWVGIM